MSNSAFTPSNNLSTPATDTQAGTVSTTAQTFAGEKTFQDGVSSDSLAEKTANNGVQIQGRVASAAIPAGYIGEIFSFTPQTITALTTGYVASSLAATLTPGKWLLVWDFTPTAVTGATYCEAAISTNNSNNSTNLVNGTSTGNTTTFTSGTFGFAGKSTTLNITANTNLYYKAISYGANRNVAFTAFAVRIG